MNSRKIKNNKFWYLDHRIPASQYSELLIEDMTKS